MGAAISPTTPPPPAAATDLNATPPAFMAAPRAGAWASPMESPIHSRRRGPSSRFPSEEFVPPSGVPAAAPSLAETSTPVPEP